LTNFNFLTTKVVTACSLGRQPKENNSHMITSLEEAAASDPFQFAVTPSGLPVYSVTLVPLADARGYMLSSLRDSGVAA